MNPTEITSKKDSAYQEIKRNILEGNLFPGQALVERKLCEDLGFSRTPVREALHRLVSEGLLDFVKGKGYFFRKSSLKDLTESFEVRLALESMSTSLIVERCEPQEVDRLEEIFLASEQAFQQKEFDIFMSYDMEFHLHIATCSKNSLLKKIITEHYDTIRIMAFSVRNDEKLCEMAYESHKKILEATKNKDKALACSIMANHIEQVKNYHYKRYYLFT